MHEKTRRVTITVPGDLLDAANRAVDEGVATSVSSYFAAAAREHGANETMRQMLDDWASELGPIPTEVAAAVDEQWRQAGVDPSAAAPAKKVPAQKTRKARPRRVAVSQASAQEVRDPRRQRQAG